MKWQYAGGRPITMGPQPRRASSGDALACMTSAQRMVTNDVVDSISPLERREHIAQRS